MTEGGQENGEFMWYSWSGRQYGAGYIAQSQGDTRRVAIQSGNKLPQSKTFQSGERLAAIPERYATYRETKVVRGRPANLKRHEACRNPKYIKAARDSPHSEIYESGARAHRTPKEMNLYDMFMNGAKKFLSGIGSVRLKCAYSSVR